MDCSGIRESLPEVGDPPKKVCAVCHKSANKQCAACKGVDYCSVEHQKSHWKVHKKTCSPIEIATSPEFGPHFVATRDLPPGTLLLTELPVLVYPFVNLEDHPSSCISCRSILPSAPWTCSKCSTPFFCNKSCSMNKIHSEFECKILSKCNEEQRDKLNTSNIGNLRAIYLKNKDPRTWTKLLGIRGTDQYKHDENSKWFILEILPHLGEQGGGFEVDMTKLNGIIKHKAIVVHPDEDHGKSHILYLRASNFSYSCFPNCTLILGQGPTFQLQVQTTVEIKKGQIPSMDFGKVSFEMGAIARQHIMHSMGVDLCICSRCTDPTGTELGTMLSAVKCPQPKCKDGYLLPIDPMDMGEDAPWRCNRAGCKVNGCTWTEIENLISRLEDDIIKFKKGNLGDAERNSKFLKILKKSLHPNHYIVVGLEWKLIYELNTKIMGLKLDQEMDFTIPQLDLHITLVEHLIKMADMFDPGLSRTRGNLLNLLFGGLKYRVLKEPDFKNRFDLRMKTADVIGKLIPIAKCHPDAWTMDDIQFLIERRRMELLGLSIPPTL